MLRPYLPRHPGVPSRRWFAPVVLVVVSSFGSSLVAAPAFAQDGEEAEADASEEEEEADEGGGSAASGENLRPFPIVETGPQAGFRTGFAKGFGKFTADSNEEINDNSRGMIPFWLDVGYRVHPNVYLGAYASFGMLLLRKGGICEGEETKCSGQNYRIGGNIVYHVMPDGDFDPWFGLGAGYEWYRNAVRYAESGVPSRSVTFRGPEWVNIQIGLDIKDGRQGGVGPFAALAIGQYSNNSIEGTAFGNAESISETITATEMHQWLFVGIQGSYFDAFL